MKSFYIIFIILLSSGSILGQVTIDIKEYDKLKADRATLAEKVKVIESLNDSIKNITKQFSNLKKDQKKIKELNQSNLNDSVNKFKEQIQEKESEIKKLKDTILISRTHTDSLLKQTKELKEKKGIIENITKEIALLTEKNKSLTNDLAPYKEFKSKNMKELRSDIHSLYKGEYLLNNKEYLLIKKKVSILETTFPLEKEEIRKLKDELNKYDKFCILFDQVETTFTVEYDGQSKNKYIKLIDNELTSKEKKPKELVEKLSKLKERLNGHCKIYLDYYVYINKLQAIIGDCEFETFKNKLLPDKLESRYPYIFNTLKDYAISTENPFIKAANLSCN